MEEALGPESLSTFTPLAHLTSGVMIERHVSDRVPHERLDSSLPVCVVQSWLAGIHVRLIGFVFRAVGGCRPQLYVHLTLTLTWRELAVRYGGTMGASGTVCVAFRKAREGRCAWRELHASVKFVLDR